MDKRVDERTDRQTGANVDVPELLSRGIEGFCIESGVMACKIVVLSIHACHLALACL